MEAIIFSYINKHYNMDYEDYIDGTASTTNKTKKIYFNGLVLDVSNVFSINMIEANKFVHKWWDIKELNVEEQIKNERFNKQILA